MESDGAMGDKYVSHALATTIVISARSVPFKFRSPFSLTFNCLSTFGLQVTLLGTSR